MNEPTDSPRSRQIQRQRVSKQQMEERNRAYQTLSRVGFDWQDLARENGEDPKAVYKRAREGGWSHLLVHRKSGKPAASEPAHVPTPQPNAPAPPVLTTPSFDEDDPPRPAKALAAPAASLGEAMTRTLATPAQRAKAAAAAITVTTLEQTAKHVQREADADPDGQLLPAMLENAASLAALGKFAAIVMPQEFGGDAASNNVHHHALTMRMEVAGPALPPGIEILEIERGPVTVPGVASNPEQP